MPSPLAPHRPNGLNNRRTLHYQQGIRKYSGLELLLMEQNCVEWVLAV